VLLPVLTHDRQKEGRREWQHSRRPECPVRRIRM